MAKKDPTDLTVEEKLKAISFRPPCLQLMKSVR